MFAKQIVFKMGILWQQKQKHVHYELQVLATSVTVNSW